MLRIPLRRGAGPTRVMRRSERRVFGCEGKERRFRPDKKRRARNFTVVLVFPILTRLVRPTFG